MKEPALGMLELKSVARGIRVTDTVVKKAPVRLLSTNAICPGKYTILFCGEVADVEESMTAGIASAGDLLINDLFLPHVHRSIIPAMTGTTVIESFGAVGIIETFSIASCIKAADIAAKEAAIQLVEVRLANGLGGKGYFVMTGDLPDVEASLEAATKHVKGEGLLAGSEIIQSPHPDLIDKGLYW